MGIFPVGSKSGNPTDKADYLSCGHKPDVKLAAKAMPSTGNLTAGKDRPKFCSHERLDMDGVCYECGDDIFAPRG